MFKKIALPLFFLFFISSVFSATGIGTTFYNETNNINWSYELWYTTSNYLEFNGTLVTKGGPFTGFGNTTYTVENAYAVLFRFPSNSEDLVFKKAPYNLSVYGVSKFDFTFKKYNTTTQIPSGTCSASSITAINSKTFQINSGLLPLQVIKNISGVLTPFNMTYQGQPLHKNPDNPVEHLLKKYYYQKAFVYFELQNTNNKDVVQFLKPNSVDGNYTYKNKTINQSGGQISTGPTQANKQYTENFTISNYNSTTKSNKYAAIYLKKNIQGTIIDELPYKLLKPEQNNISYNTKQVQILLAKFKQRCDAGILKYCGKYTLKLYSVPIDGKCDLNNSGVLDTTEYQTNYSQPIPIAQITQAGHTKTKTGTIEVFDREDIYNQTQTGTHANKFLNLSGEYIPPKKIIYNNTKYYFIDNATHLIELNLTDYPNFNNTYYNFSDNTRTFQKNITLQEILLAIPKIKKFTNITNLQNYTKNTAKIMKKTSITQNTHYNNQTNKTTTQINFTLNTTLKDVVVYKIFPKENLQNAQKIQNLNNNSLFIVDSDPIIGWYFNETSANTIEYQIDGEIVDSGTILVTQEPILFNEGDLVINYREVSCNPDEITLFEIDTLENSKVYQAGSGQFYKICLLNTANTANISKDAILANVFNISSFQNAGNYSTNYNQEPSKIQISTDDTTKTWAVKYQETAPSLKYSCLGSIENLYSSRFGDCAYQPTNRIWLTLQTDIEPPKTTLTTPFYSQYAIIEIKAEDISAVKSISYCVDENNSCTPNITKYTDYVKFNVTCNNIKYGCTKYIRYNAEDTLGNKNNTSKSYKLSLIEDGTACLSSCLASPSPNRYVKECEGMNGCSYYQYDNLGNDVKGTYVAEKCNLLLKDSWIRCNHTPSVNNWSIIRSLMMPVL